MWAYCDTSALVKRYLDELGRRELMRLLRRYDCVTSAISLVELKSALRRRVAARHVAGSRLPELLTHVVEDRSYWTLVEVGAEVLRARRPCCPSTRLGRWAPYTSRQRSYWRAACRLVV